MRCILLAFAVLASTPAGAETSRYAGQETRAIKALDPERLEGLLAGAGLGYAKSAELNGWPGPLHALELQEELDLTAQQRATIEDVRNAMLAKAKPLGAGLIAAEAELEALFADDAAEPDAVLQATAKIAQIEAELRAVHLIAHIDIKPVLSNHQRMIYARQRGYEGGHNGHGAH